MNFLKMTRFAVGLLTASLLVAMWFGAGTTLNACGESGGCTKLRNDTFALKQTWQDCNPLEEVSCILVGGNSKDCTGVLTCDFAVNPHSRVAAEQAVLTIGQESQGCYLCAVPNCLTGAPFCEPTTHQCVMVEIPSIAANPRSRHPAGSTLRSPRRTRNRTTPQTPKGLS